MQVHDFNGGIRPSGLFWTVGHPRVALFTSEDRRRATLTVRDLPVIDSFVILGPHDTPATVSFKVEWEASPRSETMELGSGSKVSETDPTAFEGSFLPAEARASFAGSEMGFAFRSVRKATSEGLFAELGRERNGAFIK